MKSDEVKFLKSAIGEVYSQCLGAVEQKIFCDIAHIGSTGPRYHWEPARLVDIDIIAFVNEFTPQVSEHVCDIRDSITQYVNGRADFEVGIYYGPYKPSALSLEKPCLFLHLILHTVDSYLERPALFRWGMGKYKCALDSDWLKRLSPPKIALNDLVFSNYGIRSLRKNVEAGVVSIGLRSLPNLRYETRDFFIGDPQFIEYCFFASAISCRNHGRVLYHHEADELGNRDYFRWYAEYVFESNSFLELMAIKDKTRDIGYNIDGRHVQKLTLNWLNELEKHCEV